MQHVRMARRLLTLALVLSLVVPTGVWAGTWPSGVTKLSVPAERVSGADRFASAAAMAQRAYPGWAGITDVIVASGDDASLVDPLSAASLCWVYDAPLLLTSKNQTPAATKAALQAIASANTTVTVHVVGGSGAVPSARISEIRSAIGTDTVEQPWLTGGRYDTAARVAARVRQVAAQKGKTAPSAVFVANGEEAKRFSDALTASAVSRATGIPVLLTRGTSAPTPTLSAVAAAGATEVIVVGGTQAVSSAVYTALGGDARWAGRNRFTTGTTVARNAVTRGWSDGRTIGLAAKIPDALAGATSLGRAGGVVLPTDGLRLPKDLFNFLIAPPVAVDKCIVLGGPRAVSDDQLRELQGHPGKPVITSPSVKYVGKTMAVRGRVNANTTSVGLYVGGTYVGARTVSPYGSFEFASVTSPSKSGTIEVRATNPDGFTCSASTTVERLNYPYATCIVIDKSDFKLYWVKDNRLIATYPVATGRPGMETPVATWKILAKYKTDPASVYGPRKMRLYRQSGSTFVYTSYLIHGTNEPWVIGTKASHGCIRMYNSDVLKLYPQVPLGTMVVTRQ